MILSNSTLIYSILFNRIYQIYSNIFHSWMPKLWVVDVLDQANVTFSTSQEGPSGTQHALLTLRRSCRCCDETKDVMHHETPYYGVCVKTGCPTFVVPADCRRHSCKSKLQQIVIIYLIYIYIYCIDVRYVRYQLYSFSEVFLTQSDK